MKQLLILILLFSTLIFIPSQSDADVRVNGDLDIVQGSGIKFYDGTLYSSKGITGPVGLAGVDGTSVTSVVLPVGDSNCPTGGVQFTSVSGLSVVCNGADAGEPLKYGKMAVVAQSGGQYTSPQAAMINVASWCGTPSSANICQVQIMAGAYDLGSTSLQLIPFVHIRGSGTASTILSGSINSSNAGVVNGASEVLLSDISIINNGGVTAQGAAFTNAIAIFNNNAATGIQNVSVNAHGAVNTYAIYNTASAPMIKETVIRDSVLSADTTAIYNGLNTNTLVHTTRFDGAGGVENLGTIICTANFLASQKTTAINLKGLDFVSAGCPGGGYGFSIVSATPIWSPSVMNGTLTQSSASVPVNSLITVTFDQNINVSTLTPTSFYIKSSSGTAVSGVMSYNSTNYSVVFTPNSPLLPNTTFTATITNAVRDARGGKLSSYRVTSPVSITSGATLTSLTEYSWQFQTSSTTETTPLIPTYFVPNNGQVVSPNQGTLNGTLYIQNSGPTLVAVGFPRQVDPRSISASSIILKDSAGVTVPGQTSLTNNSYIYGYGTTPTSPSTSYLPSYAVSTVQFYPTSQLNYGTTYTATITGINDIAGNTMPSPVSWTFSTIGGIAPTGVYAVRSGSNIVVSWQPVQSATGYNLYQCVAPDYTVPSTMNCMNPTYSVAGTTTTTVSIPNLGTYSNVTSPKTITGPFTENTQYFFNVTAVFASKEGVPSNSATLYYDTTIPTIISHGNLDVVFSETIDWASLQNNFSVRDSLSNLVYGSFGSFCNNTGCDQRGVTFYPNNPLQTGNIYAVALTSGIKDLGGNALIGASWIFSQPINTLSANNTGRSINVTWQPVEGATGYTLYWSPNTISISNAFKVSLSGTSYTQQNMPDGYYCYLVTYTKGGIESTVSNQAYAFISSPPPPPVVISTNPSNNATDVYTNNPITVDFSAYLDSTSCSQDNITLKDNLGTSVPVYINCYNSSSVTLFSQNQLKTDTNYLLTISGIRSSAGTAMTGTFTLSFTTNNYIYPPSDIRVSAGIRENTLIWNPSTSGTTYNLYWSTSPNISTGNSNKIINVVPPYTHSGLAAGTTYYYIMTSENLSFGESYASFPVSATALDYDVNTPLTSIEVIGDSSAIAANTSLKLAVRGNFSGLFTRDITDQVVWSSDNIAVADFKYSTAPNKNRVSGNSVGTAVVTATVGNLSATYTLMVSNATVTAMTISTVPPATPTAPLGLTKQFAVIGTFSDLTSQDLTFDATWSASQGAFATISNDPVNKGLATAIAKGTEIITASFGTSPNIVTVSSPLTVTDSILQTIVVTPANSAITGFNKTLNFTATGLYSDGTMADITSTVIWGSSFNSVASINSLGLATTVASGKTSISATLGDISGKTDLTVSPLTLKMDGLQISPANPTISLGTGITTLQLTLTATFADNSTQNVTSSAIWTIPSASSIATVGSTTGLVTVSGVGTVTIQATYLGQTVTITVTITQ